MRIHRPMAAAATLVAAAGLATMPASAAPPIDTEPLQDAVTVEGMVEHMAELEAIAMANPFEGVPTRATGTPGHEASVEYVVEVMEAAGFEVTLQPFEADIFFEQGPAAFERVSPDPVVYPRYDGTTGVWYTADFSGDGDVTAVAAVVDFVEPTTEASASSAGCEASDYDGIDVTGLVVLLQRGTCDFGLKAEIAEDEGAAAVVLFNEGTIGAPDRNDVLIPTLAGYDVGIPVVGTDYATGRELVDLVAETTVTLRVSVDGFINEDVITHNVIAESTTGRTDRTVVVGGHLDSVYEGPGTNDNGSGIAMMLETAQQMDELGIEPVNQVRFIFFSGEEQGLVGSDYYVSQLTAREVRDISVMLNFDMIASGNYARFVYDGDGSDHGIAGPNGSGSIERVFAEHFQDEGLAFETTPFDGRSDYDAFTAVGIPAGGLFSGAEEEKQPYQVPLYGGTAGVAFDPCYHQLCDVLANISEQGLDELGDAAVHAIATFALTRSAPNGTARGAAPSMGAGALVG